ncbi:MAG: hypothetical protein Greene07147_879 [Parcubacteria group bacterium Greene0714_7]|nr:MAG: hypothetical protein Greene07147_879 [Parcubacteria group bacterium Greene0714_7]
MKADMKNAHTILMLASFVFGALVVGGVWFWSVNSSGIVFDGVDTSGNIFQVASSTGDNYFTVTADGKVGVRNQAPTTELDVYGMIRTYSTEPRECTTAIEGAIRYDALYKKFLGCNGVEWRRLDGTP